MKLPVRKCYHAAKVGFFIILVVTILTLFEKWRGGKRSARAQNYDPEDEFEREILEDEARIIPGLGEGGVAAHLIGEAQRLGEESEKKLAINVYLSDRIAYNRTLQDHRNPACERIVYDAELPSASVILIFHNEPYSVVIRTIWSVINSARRDQPWYKKANYIDRETGRTMKLGYPGQDPKSPFVYLKEIILVDDNSTLQELKGKLSHYVRTRLPPDLIRILRLPDRVGVTQARYAGSRIAISDVMIFLDSHCECDYDWLRPLLQRIKDKRTAVVTPIIDLLEQDTFEYNSGDRLRFEVIVDFFSVGLTRARLAGARYATGDALVFLDSHCEAQRDWLRPLLHRIKESPHTVVVPIIDVIEASNFYYSVQDPVTFQGLMRARITGARAARGDALVFLDAHCEAGADWLRPLLQRLRRKRDAVLTPLIDVVDQTTFQLDAAQHFQVGGFTFMGHFTWIDVPEREKKRRGSDIAPTWSPTMAGGLFAINRAYYWEVGAYDEQMAGWGGENLEMSFRVWQCGGTLETIPCSRVGHVFRSFHPYGLPAQSDTHGINTARMAEVWMDDYAELFYLHRPDLRKNPKIGDVTHRRVLREKLKCKSFQWYLDNVYREKFVPVRDVYGFGRFSNPPSGLCLDTLQREGEAAALGLYSCHGRLEATQYLALSLRGELRDEEKCAEVQYARSNPGEVSDDLSRRVLMVTCHGKQRGQKWRYLPTGQLQHTESRLCLTSTAASGSDALATKCRNVPQQVWKIDYSELNDFRLRNDIEPSEQELKLRKLRGQRRISRSLLSYREEGADPRRHHHKKAKHKHKKGKKNKFILKLVRGNRSEEHLEADVYCRHRRLFPNNSFVRDLVSILNARDIKVINNGRVFEHNRVSELVTHEQPPATPKPVTPDAEPLEPKPQRKRKLKKASIQPLEDAVAPDAADLMDITSAAPEKKIIIEDFVEVKDNPSTTQRVAKKRRKRVRLRDHSRRTSRPSSTTADWEDSMRAEGSLEDTPMVGEAPDAESWPLPESRSRRNYSRSTQRRDYRLIPTFPKQDKESREHYRAGGGAGSDPSPPVKVVMRSNLTFNLGDEFFNWQKRTADDVVNLLGELVIPANTSRQHASSIESDKRTKKHKGESERDDEKETSHRRESESEKEFVHGEGGNRDTDLENEIHTDGDNLSGKDDDLLTGRGRVVGREDSSGSSESGE